MNSQSVRKGALQTRLCLQSVSLFRQAIGQVKDHFLRVVFIDYALHHQPGQPVGTDPAPEVVTRRNRGIGAGIVVKTCQVLDSRRLDRGIKETAHAQDAIKKPPGRPQAQRWIVSGQRREFTTIGCLVKIEEYQRQTLLAPEAVQQGLEVARKLAGDRDIRAHIAAKARENLRIMVACAANMQLHDQTVLHAHARHFNQHVAGETPGLIRTGLASQGTLENRLGLALVQLRGIGGERGVISSRRAHLFEKAPSLLKRGNIRAVPGDVDAGCLAQLLNLPGKAGLDIDHSVRAESWNHAPGPAGSAYTPVLLQQSGRGIGCCQYFDVEALKQAARLEFGLTQPGIDGVIDGLRVFRSDFLFNPKDITQFITKPEAGWRPAKQGPVIAECLPDFAVVPLHRPAIQAWNAQSLQGNPLRIEHTKHVVIGDNQQINGCAPFIVLICQQTRIDMSMRADQGQGFDLSIQLAGKLPLRGIRRKITIFSLLWHRHARLLSFLLLMKVKDTLYL